MTNAYMFFVKEQHKIISSENPGRKMTDIAVVLGNKWRNMTDEQKKLYQQQSDDSPKTKTKTKTKTAPKIKRELNPYMKFVQRERTGIAAENPNLKLTELSKLMGQMWRSKSDSEKVSYK
jgi:hypothetical protein